MLQQPTSPQLAARPDLSEKGRLSVVLSRSARCSGPLFWLFARSSRQFRGFSSQRRASWRRDQICLNRSTVRCSGQIRMNRSTVRCSRLSVVLVPVRCSRPSVALVGLPVQVDCPMFWAGQIRLNRSTVRCSVDLLFSATVRCSPLSVVLRCPLFSVVLVPVCLNKSTVRCSRPLFSVRRLSVVLFVSFSVRLRCSLSVVLFGPLFSLVVLSGANDRGVNPRPQKWSKRRGRNSGEQTAPRL